MFIDKFYRVYDKHPHSQTEARSSKEPVMPIISLKDDCWNALNYKIASAKEGENFDDVSTLGQTLTRKGDGFVQGKQNFEFMEAIENKWEAKKRKISNVDQGEHSNDVPILEQVLTKKGDGFVQGNENFQFMELKDGKWWSAKNRRITSLAEGIDDTDSVNMSQVPKSSELEYDCRKKRLVMVRKAINPNDVVVERQTIVLEPTEKTFYAKDKIISGLKPGESSSDAAVISQIVTYDKEKGVFKFNDLTFKLMEYNPKILVADPTSRSGFKTLDGNPYIPKNYVFQNEEGDLVDYNGEIFKCLKIDKK